jgi:hypothetical protein
MTSRAELNVDLFNSLRIALGAGAAWRASQFGALHTMITLKVERASTSARSTAARTGVMFQDRNGIRDPGEPGAGHRHLPRRRRQITDANGEFRMARVIGPPDLG